MMDSSAPSRQPESHPVDLPEPCSKHHSNRFFGHIQRKLSVPSQRLREQAAFLGRRRSKKFKQVNNPPRSSESVSLGFDVCEDKSSSPDRETDRKRKYIKRQRDSPFPERNNRIDRMFQVIRRGKSLELPEDALAKNFQDVREGTLPVPGKENKDATSLSNKRCIECVRRLMERQTLNEVEQRKLNASLLEEKIIPEGTRQAFGIYNGCWVKTHEAIRDQLFISGLFNKDDADQGEFYLFYKRILHYLLIRDAIFSLDYEPTCLSRSQLTPNIRATLFDWMIKVQQYLHMGTESLHLATSLVDHFVSRTQIAEHNYQLVGITALFLSGKINERQAASLRTLCYLTEHSYIPKQVLEWEQTMLEVFNFDLHVPLPHHFLGSALLSCDDLPEHWREQVRLICLYLFDLGLTEFELSKYSASLRCAAALYLGRRLLLGFGDLIDSRSSPSPELENHETIKRPPLWSRKQAELTGHIEDQRLRRVALIYAAALARIQQRFSVSPTGDDSRLTVNVTEAAFIKYSNRHYGRVARLSQLMNFRYSRLLEELTLAC